MQLSSARLLGALAVVSVVASGALGAVPTGAAERSARARLRSAMEADLRSDPAIPGEALAVRAPGVDLALAVGRADRSAAAHLSPDAPFRIASVTKTFVAAAVLRLVELHDVALDAPVGAYLTPASVATLRGDGYDVDHMTVRHLLTHTAGLYDYASSDAYDRATETDPSHEWTRAEQLQLAVDLGAPVAAPGERFHYSDTGYVLLGEIVERVTGEPLAAAVRRLLHFDRLGLADTWWEELEPPPADLLPAAHQYAGDFDGAALDPSFDLYGGGGLVSTVADVTTFFRALFGGDVFDDPRTLDTMTTVVSSARGAGAAIGLFSERVAGERCYTHAGYWGTVATYCPRLDLAFARTINQADDDRFDYGRLDRVVVDVARRARVAGS
jgi:D-alanyl-D-alanine carboxypeptidase